MNLGMKQNIEINNVSKVCKRDETEGVPMIDLVNSNAVIYSTEYAGLDQGRVVKQDSGSIVVEFVDPSNYITLTKHIEYDYPAAFLDNRIVIRGNANNFLIRDIELNKQLDAVSATLRTLDSQEDSAYEVLLSKRNEIKKELADNIRAFDEDIKDSRDKECKNFIARDESEIEEELLRLADRIDNLVFLKNEIDNYSGFKLSKKYKNLKNPFNLREKFARP